VFERFRQADEAVSRRQSGLGLGLTLVRHIVGEHGGSVTASSEGEGHGATFTIRLPQSGSPVSRRTDVERVAPAPSGTHQQPAGELANVAVLVVDDDDARDLVVTALRQQGARVAEAGSLEEALRHLAESAIDILVSDIDLPSAGGYGVMGEIRARGYSASQLPAIALTSYDRREDRRLALEAGFQAHVAKPVAPAELIAVVQAFARPLWRT
jgi:CheY-like chemotaxis protein